MIAKFFFPLIIMFLAIIISGCDNRTEEEKMRDYYKEVKGYSEQIKSIVKKMDDKKISNEEAYKELNAIMKKFDKLDKKIEALNFGKETGRESEEILNFFYESIFDDEGNYVGFGAIKFKVTPENRNNVLIFTRQVLERTSKNLYNAALFYAQKSSTADSNAGSSAYSIATNTTFLTLAGEVTQEDAIYSIEMLDCLFASLK
jgi:hypothetical protein